MRDFYLESVDFVKTLYEQENLTCMEIAKFCGVSWGVVSAIVNDEDYDMGTTNHRKILRKSIEWYRLKKIAANQEILKTNSELNSYKGNREVNHYRRITETERMRPL